MTPPDYTKAATKAAETLIKYNVSSAPVDPLRILKSIPNVLVLSYEKLSQDVGMDRRCVISMFGRGNEDAVTTVNITDGQPQYVVTYNQQLSSNLFQRALARELGHIVLGHDGSRPEDVRNEEAICYAHHLLCPRALIYSLKAINIRLTVDFLGSMTGCYDYCISCMRRMPRTDVPPELNRQVREQFFSYVINAFHYYRFNCKDDGSASVDFGSYMEGYRE